MRSRKSIVLLFSLLAGGALGEEGPLAPPVRTEVRRIADLTGWMRSGLIASSAHRDVPLREALFGFQNSAMALQALTELPSAGLREVGVRLRDLVAREPLVTRCLQSVSVPATVRNQWDEVRILLAGIRDFVFAYPGSAPAGSPAASSFLHPALVPAAAEAASRLREEACSLRRLLDDAISLPGLFDRELLQSAHQLEANALQTEALLLVSPVFAEPVRNALAQLDGASSRVGAALRRRLLSQSIAARWACLTRSLERLYCTLRSPVATTTGVYGAFSPPLIQGNPIWWNTGAFATGR